MITYLNNDFIKNVPQGEAVNTTSELADVSVLNIPNYQKRLVIDDNIEYIYYSAATSGDVQPNVQIGGKGYWNTYDITYQLSGDTLFTGYTATTEIRLDGIDDDITFLGSVSGESYSLTGDSLFTGYTATTNIRLDGIDDDIAYISGQTNNIWDYKILYIDGDDGNDANSGAVDQPFKGLIAAYAYAVTNDITPVTFKIMAGGPFAGFTAVGSTEFIEFHILVSEEIRNNQVVINDLHLTNCSPSIISNAIVRDITCIQTGTGNMRMTLYNTTISDLIGSVVTLSRFSATLYERSKITLKVATPDIRISTYQSSVSIPPNVTISSISLYENSNIRMSTTPSGNANIGSLGVFDSYVDIDITDTITVTGTYSASAARYANKANLILTAATVNEVTGEWAVDASLAFHDYGEVFVDRVDGLDSNDGTEGFPFKTPQGAYDAAVIAGDTSVVMRLMRSGIEYTGLVGLRTDGITSITIRGNTKGITLNGGVTLTDISFTFSTIKITVLTLNQTGTITSGGNLYDVGVTTFNGTLASGDPTDMQLQLYGVSTFMKFLATSPDALIQVYDFARITLAGATVTDFFADLNTTVTVTSPSVVTDIDLYYGQLNLFSTLEILGNGNLVGVKYIFKDNIIETGTVFHTTGEWADSKLSTDSVFTGYTATTEVRLDGIDDDIAFLGSVSGDTNYQLSGDSLFTGYTASTNVRLDNVDLDIIYLSGQTDINTADIATLSGATGDYVQNTTFTGYTATTDIRLDNVDLDIIYISGQTDLKLNITAFTGYSATTETSFNESKYAEIISVTGNTSLDESYNNKIIEVSGTTGITGITITIPTGVTVGWQIVIANMFDGIVTINSSGSILSKGNAVLLETQFGAASLYHRGDNSYFLFGDIS